MAAGSVGLARFRGLGWKISLAALIGIAAYAAFVIWYSEGELRDAYAAAGKQEVLAIARTFADDFEGLERGDSAVVQRRLDALRRLNPNLLRATLYALRDGRGVRLGSTDRSRLGTPVAPHDVEPIRTGRYEYEEEREDGEHVAELNFPSRVEAQARRSASTSTSGPPMRRRPRASAA